MSHVYNPETEVIEAIERQELEARSLRHRLEKAKTESDRRSLRKQLAEVEQHIEFLRRRLI